MVFIDSLPFLVALLVSLLLSKLLIGWLRRSGTMDIPNSRSSHTTPTPRGGGLAILLGILAATVVAQALFHVRFPAYLWLGATVVAATGLMDDLLGHLHSGWRFLIQLGAAAGVTYLSGGFSHWPLPDPLNVPMGILSPWVTIIWILGFINLFNFLDGIDGYAGSLSLIAGLGVYAFAGPSSVGLLGLAIAGGCLGFLVFNWHPARIFMGDVSSYTLGYLFAVMPLLDAGPSDGLGFAVAMMTWMFLADGSLTLFHRIVKKQRFWEAHRAHMYQRLVRTGLKHDQVTLWLVFCSITLTCLVVLARWRPWLQWTTLVVALLLIGWSYLWTHRRHISLQSGR